LLATVAATGNTGTLHYTLDAASAKAGFGIDDTGKVTVGTAPVLSSWPITVTATETTTMAPGSSAYGSQTVTFNVNVTTSN
jgi:hypothetical protein